jgi:hypothetical protein
MLRRSNLQLDGPQSRELHACTSGWPVGVKLATAVLRGGVDPSTFLQRFAASDPEPAADFLVREVLAVLPVADRDLLSGIGVGGPITDALAAILSGRGDAGEVLDRLARDSGLVERGSAGRFWVHPPDTGSLCRRSSVVVQQCLPERMQIDGRLVPASREAWVRAAIHARQGCGSCGVEVMLVAGDGQRY